MKNIVAILVLTSFSAGLFASNPHTAGGESPRTAANRKWAMDRQMYATMLENTLGPAIEAKTLTYAKTTAALGNGINSAALQDFCDEHFDVIGQIAQEVIANSNPTVQEFENAFAALQLIKGYGSDNNQTSARELLTQLEQAHWRVITNAALIEVSDTTTQEALDNGLAACNLLPRLTIKLSSGKGADKKEVDLQEWADERRPGFEAALSNIKATAKNQKKDRQEEDASRVVPIDDEEFGLDTPKSSWSIGFSKKGLMTIGGIALIAAAVYYFGFAKKDAKTAKGNPQPKK